MFGLTGLRLTGPPYSPNQTDRINESTKERINEKTRQRLFLGGLIRALPDQNAGRSGLRPFAYSFHKATIPPKPRQAAPKINCAPHDCLRMPLISAHPIPPTPAAISSQTPRVTRF